MRYYGLDLLDLGTARLSWRRLARLIRHLPRESCTARAIDPTATAWSDSDYLLALVVDGVNASNYLLRSAPHFKHPPRKPPKPTWRPGDAVRQVMDGASALARYEAIKTQIAEVQAAVLASGVEEVTTVWQSNSPPGT